MQACENAVKCTITEYTHHDTPQYTPQYTAQYTPQQTPPHTTIHITIHHDKHQNTHHNAKPTLLLFLGYTDEGYLTMMTLIFMVTISFTNTGTVPISWQSGSILNKHKHNAFPLLLGFQHSDHLAVIIFANDDSQRLGWAKVVDIISPLVIASTFQSELGIYQLTGLNCPQAVAVRCWGNVQLSIPLQQ